MKNLILLFILISASGIYSQWIWQNPEPTGAPIRGLYFLNEAVGFAGADRSILKTTDGGLTWHKYDLDASLVNTIFFIDEITGWCAGFGGKIFKTTNCGESWFTTAEIPGYDFFSIYFVSPDTGFAAGSQTAVFRTTDGGITWDKKTFYSSSSAIMRCVYFYNNKTGYAGGDASNDIWITTDTGESWYRRSLIYQSHYINSICFVNDKIGFVAGDQKSVAKTTDGGAYWINLTPRIPVSYNMHFRDIFFHDSLNGWLAGSELYRTTDGGMSWQKRSADQESITNVVFPTPSVGYCSGFNGLLKKTTNGGLSWFSLTKGERQDINAGFFIDKQIGWAAGSRQLILKTTDGGENWVRKLPLGTEDFFSVFFISESTGWVAGYGQLKKTTDGGESWFNLNTAANYQSVFFIDENYGWAAGSSMNFENSILSRTTDGGSTWTSIQFFPPNILSSVHFISRETGFTSGFQKILRTTDGGLTWNEISLGDSTGYVFSISFADEKNGFAAGTNGYPNGFVCKTTDAGETWTRVTGQDFHLLTKIQALDEFHVFATGTYLYFSENGGENWIKTDWGKFLEHSNSSLFFITKDVGWMFSAKGIINKTFTRGILESEIVSREIPEMLLLNQNYPNPFNPNTVITYEIPYNAHLNITIYDALGREIEVLVNEEKSAGKFELSWNGSKFSSGIYFCRIRSDNFTQTIKMVLLR